MEIHGFFKPCTWILELLKAEVERFMLQVHIWLVLTCNQSDDKCIHDVVFIT